MRKDSPVQPAGRLDPQPWMLAPATRKVLGALTRGGADARFVGGCVRDAVLGRSIKDIDIATHAPPDEVIRLLVTAGLKALPTGLRHGTVTAVADGAHFEITTLRRDVQSFGRHAQVEFTDDWQSDAARRDFTINAMFCAPDGTLFDPFGGLRDLAAGRVRFVGNPRSRLEEDILRLLRYFRFQAYYGRNVPDPEALDACRAMVDRLPTLSGERVRSELLRLLGAPDPATAWRLIEVIGAAPYLLPLGTHAECLERLVQLQNDLGIPAADDPLLRLAALLGVNAPPNVAAQVAQRLRLSNNEQDRLIRLLTDSPATPIEATTRQRRRVLYHLGSELYLDRILLTAAGEAADETETMPAHSHKFAHGYKEERGENARLAVRLVPAFDAAAAWQNDTFPLKGRDLLALGVPAGPRIGQLLHAVEAWWVESDCHPDHAACLDEARRRLTTSCQSALPHRR